MAKVLKKLPDGVEFHRGKPKKYPWDDWLNGSIWELREGEDFNTTPKKFRFTAHAAAKARGLYLQTIMKDSTLIIQASTEPWSKEN